MKTIFTLLTFFIITANGFCQFVDDENFKVYNVRNETDGSVTVYASNNHLCDESVLVEFTALKNMKADVEIPFKSFVPAGAKEFKLFTLSIKDLTKESQLGYIAKHCHGDIYNKKHDNSYVYTIPYKAGEQYPLEQAYGGKILSLHERKNTCLRFYYERGDNHLCCTRWNCY